MDALRLEGSRRFSLELQCLERLRIVEHRNLVAVLITATINDLLHFIGSGLAQHKGLNRGIVAPGLHRDLRNIRVQENALKLLNPGLRLRLDHVDNDGCRLAHDNRRENRVLSGCTRRRHTGKRQQAQRAKPRRCQDAFHSISSVWILKDFKNRTSWGVMVSRAAVFFSGSCSNDSWSTWMRKDSRNRRSWVVMRGESLLPSRLASPMVASSLSTIS